MGMINRKMKCNYVENSITVATMHKNVNNNGINEKGKGLALRV